MLGELFCAYIYSERRSITSLNWDGLIQVLEDLLYESLGPGEGVTGADLYLTYLVYGFIMAMVRSGFPDRRGRLPHCSRQCKPGRAASRRRDRGQYCLQPPNF